MREGQSREKRLVAAVHWEIWRCETAWCDDEVLATCAKYLSDDERGRLEAAASTTRRCEFALGRGLLRWVLSQHAPLLPKAWRFALAASGKPYALLPAPQPQSIAFNLAHSGGAIVCAVAHGAHAVGVDIEDHTQERQWQAIARRWFAPTELAHLEALAPEAARDAFWDLWTMKEARAKALGESVVSELGRPLAAAEGRHFLANLPPSHRVAAWVIAADRHAQWDAPACFDTVPFIWTQEVQWTSRPWPGL